MASAALLTAGATGCGGDAAAPTPAGVSGTGRGTVTVTLPPPNGQPLPPDTVVGVDAVYGPSLATLGVRLTRAGLYQTSGGGYDRSAQGTHLALYAEPLHAIAADDYTRLTWETSALLTPDVFARWSGLRSYDVCLEPVPGVGDAAEPPAVTQVVVERDAAPGVDWRGGSLTDLLAASRRGPGITVTMDEAVRGTAAYRDADASAGARGFPAPPSVAPSPTTRATGPSVDGDDGP